MFLIIQVWVRVVSLFYAQENQRNIQKWQLCVMWLIFRKIKVSIKNSKENAGTLSRKK